MKYLVLLVVVLVVFWLWRSKRDADIQERAHSKPRPEAPPHDIVACPVCDVHLPARDAVRGELALYCCAEHRQQAEH